MTPAQTKIIACWVLFGIAFAFGKIMGDFDYPAMDAPTYMVIIVKAKAPLALAVLSAANVYWIPYLVKLLGPDKYARQFWAALIGFFGLTLSLPC